jgi:hypothetical protein
MNQNKTLHRVPLFETKVKAILFVFEPKVNIPYHNSMNIYFTASLAAKQQYIQHYQQIVDTLKKLKCLTIADHIFAASESSIKLQTREERLQFHAQLEDWINHCDCVVVEASFPSISVGYEISMALHRGKPVLILYSEGDPPSLLAYHENERIICERYTKESLSSILSEFIAFVKGNADTRFTFFITPKIAAHLEARAKKEKLPKSVYLRKLIEKDMNEAPLLSALSQE